MKSRWFPVWIFPLALLMAVGTVWLRLRIIDTTYEIGQIDRSLRNVRQDKDRTELAVARLKSPLRLEQLARSRFKLASPQARQIIHLGKPSR